MSKNRKWGFLRETEVAAQKAGIDKDTGLHRTGLEVYLKTIFPDVDDWVHDKAVPHLIVNCKSCRRRPDYRSEKLKMIVEFDGLQHYTNPDIIERDIESTNIYECFGYKVVRIPYFIQLTNRAVKVMFNVDVLEELFDEKVPSLSINGRNTPAYLCHAGVKRMIEEFNKFPEQYKVNVDFLKTLADRFKSGIELLELSDQVETTSPKIIGKYTPLLL